MSLDNDLSRTECVSTQIIYTGCREYIHILCVHMVGICGAVAQLTGLNEACGVVQLSLISQVSHEKSEHHKNAWFHITGMYVR